MMMLTTCLGSMFSSRRRLMVAVTSSSSISFLNLRRQRKSSLELISIYTSTYMNSITQLERN